MVITPGENVSLNHENKIVYFKSDYEKKENKCDMNYLCG